MDPDHKHKMDWASNKRNSMFLGILSQMKDPNHRRTRAYSYLKDIDKIDKSIQTKLKHS